MSNMHYCMFENTSNDFRAVFNKMFGEEMTPKLTIEVISGLSEYEKDGLLKLLNDVRHFMAGASVLEKYLLVNNDNFPNFSKHTMGGYTEYSDYPNDPNEWLDLSNLTGLIVKGVK